MRRLTTEEAGRLLGYSGQIVRKQITKGMLPGYTLPGSKHRRVLLSDVITFANQHRIPLDRELLTELGGDVAAADTSPETTASA